MRKLLYLVTEDWFFVSHFLPMARAAGAAGFEVVVATRVREHGDKLVAAGVRVIGLDIVRESLGLLEGIRNVAEVRRIVRAERPDIVHCIALKPVVLGGVAARLGGAGRLALAPTGLGHLWTNTGIFARLGRAAVRTVV